MKKFFTLLLVIVALVAGGADMSAKTPAKKKSTTSSQSVKFQYYPDGYPIVNGHTYTCTLQGVKCTLKFGAFYGLEDAVEIKVANEIEYEGFQYQGDGVIFFYMAGQPIYMEISDDGKKLVTGENDDIVFKLVR